MKIDERIHLAEAYVRDTIAALDAVGDFKGAANLDDTLVIDGPDIDACIAYLGLHGLVTQEWVDRLAYMNSDHDWDEELEELTGYLHEQQPAS